MGKKICIVIILILTFCLILSTAQNIALDSKYENALKMASICEVKAYRAKLPTNQPITLKHEKELRALDKEFLQDFSKEARKIVAEERKEEKGE